MRIALHPKVLSAAVSSCLPCHPSRSALVVDTEGEGVEQGKETMAETSTTDTQLLDELTSLRQQVAEFRQKEHALLQAKETAETDDRNKSEFLATLSHELRTPIDIILGYTDLLLEGAFGSLTADQNDALHRIERNAHELFELVSAMLDLSRLEAGQLPIELQEVYVPKLIAEIQSELQEVSEHSQLEFAWPTETDLPPVYTDPGKLKTVLKNLVRNAVKFTLQGRVSVDARVGQGGIEIVVSDTGIGIPQEALPLIFEPFRQLENPSTGQFRGTGLGLHIVKRLLETLSGKVSVASEVGRGSSFCVWIPAGEADKDPTALVCER